MNPFAALDHEPRWVAWRNEQHGSRVTKVPRGRGGKQAKADDPSTWLVRADAEALYRRIANGELGGIGLELGLCAPDVALGGIDLDTCRAPDGRLEPWAREVIARFASYAEVSPSGTGVKVFLYYAADEIDALRKLMGEQDGRQFKRGGGDHPPAIELYINKRYFAVTEEHLAGTPTRLCLVPYETLRWLLQEAGPAFQGGKQGKDRSAIAFRKGAALRRAGCTFEEMVEALRRDPDTAVWAREKGEVYNQRELRRIWDKAAPPGQQPGRVIRVIAGLRHEAADAGLAALHAAGVGFYQRNRSLVRVCSIKAKASDGAIIFVPGVMPVEPAALGRALGQSAYWEKFEARGKLVRIDPPRPVVEQILGMIEEWPFPALAGVITCPTLRPDGSLLAHEGYDLATGLVLHNAITLPPVSETPTKDEAKAAATLLEGLLSGFPFTSRASRAVALSKILTPILRGAFTLAPMHQTSAPEAGSGKSYLDDIAATVATGERCAVIAVSPNPEETEKRLIGAALAGHPIIALDNVRMVLEGDFLCQVTERPLLQLRPLGTSDELRVANTFTVFVNGNNLAVADDLVRRGIRCSLDANTETPETRTFSSNPRAMALGNRGAYIAAGLIIGRAYIAAGRPDRQPHLPSYEGWSDLVRSALVWLGYDDPVDTMDDIRGTDPVRQERAGVFGAWRDELNLANAYLAAELVEFAESSTLPRPKLRVALLAVAAKRGRGSEIDPRRLGIWLKKNENTIVGRFKLTVDRSDVQRPRWQLGLST